MGEWFVHRDQTCSSETEPGQPEGVHGSLPRRVCWLPPLLEESFSGRWVIFFHSLNLDLYNAYGLQSFLDTNMSLSLILKRKERSYYNPLCACERTEAHTAKGFLTAPAMVSPQQKQSTFRHSALTPVP